MAYRNPKPFPNLSQEKVTLFWSRVDKRSPEECWHWLAGKTSSGYGVFAPEYGTNLRAHLVAYILANGDTDLLVCHKCDNPPCCNPAHLFQGTTKDNAVDRCQKGRGHQGDKHWSRMHPEKVPRGDGNIARRRPDLLARGDRNGARLHPELHPRGERVGNSKLTANEVAEIIRRHDPKLRNATALAREFGVSSTMIGYIVHGKWWRHVTATESSRSPLSA